MHDLHQFFAQRHFIETHSHFRYDPLQWGSKMQFATQERFDLDEADVVLIGCGEQGGQHEAASFSQAPDAIRKELYQLYQWHPEIRITDAGNILQGATTSDTRAALRTVLQELHDAGKIVLVLGGSHDLTMQQYEAFSSRNQLIDAVIADAWIDLDESELMSDRSFLMDMLTAQPNFVRHYTHLGFQSYFVHPRMLETLDQLRFDFIRVGRLRENLEEAEPALRAADLFSVDMNVLRYSDAPANTQGSPNGLHGDEACTLTRYAGMATHLSSFGIYGYEPKADVHQMTAKLIAQMIWYFVEGLVLRRQEASLSERNEFTEFNVRFTANDSSFLKSRRSRRWWMQMPDGSFVPCTYNDYLAACNNEIPERWLREQERLS
ncbi:MAG: formimidoylglutamase [Bacteroidetes bacterium]|nr:formimidoylglutamase [Bacteroidota bacterium]MBS1630114.1 formimidoylglutamase [Bacteroidota bacterium]